MCPSTYIQFYSKFCENAHLDAHFYISVLQTNWTYKSQLALELTQKVSMMLKYDLYGNSNSEPNYFFFFGPIANILLTKFLYAKSSIQLKFTFHFISFSVWISEGQPIASYTILLQISFCAVIFPFCFHKMMIIYFYFAIVIHRLSYTNVWINVQCACLCV